MRRRPGSASTSGSGSAWRLCARQQEPSQHGRDEQQTGAGPDRDAVAVVERRPDCCNPSPDSPATSGSAATASRLPERATALLMPLATPASVGRRGREHGDVSGATRSVKPSPASTIGRRRRPSSSSRRRRAAAARRRPPRRRRRARAGSGRRCGCRAPPARGEPTQQNDRHRERGRAGLRARRSPTHELQLQDEEEDQAAERAVDQQRDEVDHAELDRSEQRRRHHRLAPSSFPPDERGQQRAAPAMPAHAVAFHQRERDAAKPDRAEHRAEHVEAAGLVDVAALRDEAQRGQRSR